MIAKLYTSPFWVPLPCWPLPARRSSGAVHIKPKGATVRWADENLLRVAHLVYFALKIWNRKVLVRRMAGTMSCVQGQRHFSLAVSLWPWSVKEHMYQHIVRGAWSKSYPGGVQFIHLVISNQNKRIIRISSGVGKRLEHIWKNMLQTQPPKSVRMLAQWQLSTALAWEELKVFEWYSLRRGN